MKVILELKDKIEDESEIWDFYPDSPNGEKGLSLYVGENQSLEDALQNKSGLASFLEIYIDFSGDEESKELLKNIDYIEDYIEFVVLNFEKKDTLDFIKNNDLLKDKKIVIPEPIYIDDSKKLEEIAEKYKEYRNQIYINLLGNETYASLEDCQKAINYISAISDHINELGLSPMEIVMYTYDLVRNRLYNYNEEGLYSYSRDLSSIIDGDEIVCVGFANLFYSILARMSMKVLEVSLKDIKNEKEGHRIVKVYVKDDKYDIDGVYYFDPTFDCKKEGQTNEFLYVYRFFAKTRNEMYEKYEKELVSRGHEYYSEDIVEDFLKIVKEQKKAQQTNEKMNMERINTYVKTINMMSRMVSDKNLLDFYQFLPIAITVKEMDVDKTIKGLRVIEQKHNNPIGAEKYLDILNNVRRVQHEENPEFYPYSMTALGNAYLNSDWKFTEELSDIQQFMFILAGNRSKDYKEYRENLFIKYYKSGNLNIEESSKPQVKVKK